VPKPKQVPVIAIGGMRLVAGGYTGKELAAGSEPLKLIFNVNVPIGVVFNYES
jgi:hypothetical protein